MRVFLAALVLLVAACAAPPVEEKESPVSLYLEGEDVSVGAAIISSASGREIVVEPGIEHPVVLALSRVPWRLALERLCDESRCKLVDRPDGSLEVERLAPVEKKVDSVLLADVLRDVAHSAWENVVVATDVTDHVSFETASLVTVGDDRRLLRWLVAHFGLESLQVGEILVISHAHLELDIAEGQDDERIDFEAWNAPADGWFSLLERITGRRVQHGQATINAVSTVETSADSVLRATALASRVPRTKQLPDPSPRSDGWRVQAWASHDQNDLLHWRDMLALVNGRAVADGDRLTDDVLVYRVRRSMVFLSEKGYVFPISHF